MAQNVLTPEFRAAYVGLFRPSAPRDNPGGAKKYSIRAIFAPGTDLSEMKREAQQVAKDKWAANVPKALRSPFRTNAELDSPIPGVADDAIVMTFSASEDRRPGLVDAKLYDIIEESAVYSGAWFRDQVRAFAYEASGNRGVSFGLQNVQFLRNDEPLGAGRVPANKVFEAVDVDASSNAGSIFG